VHSLEARHFSASSSFGSQTCSALQNSATPQPHTQKRVSSESHATTSPRRQMSVLLTSWALSTVELVHRVGVQRPSVQLTPVKVLVDNTAFGIGQSASVVQGGLHTEPATRGQAGTQASAGLAHETGLQ
jgi:hypothetical protein